MRYILLFSVFSIVLACKDPVVNVVLDADPEFVCIPGETELSWTAYSVNVRSVSTDLSVSNTDDETFDFVRLPFSSNAEMGEIVIGVPAGNTEFRASSRGSPPVTDQDVASVYGMGTETLDGAMTFEPDCGDAGEVNGWQSVTLSGYSGRIAPRGVTNISDREIIISHSGVSRPLAPMETSSAWNGTNLGGEWSVSADLLFRSRRGAETVTESCDPSIGPGGATSPTTADGNRTIQVQPLSVSFAFGCAL